MMNGNPYLSLRRLLTVNGLTPDEYRQRYGIEPNYPMAPHPTVKAVALLQRGLVWVAKAITHFFNTAVGSALPWNAML